MVLNFHISFLHRDGLLDRKRDADLKELDLGRHKKISFKKNNCWTVMAGGSCEVASKIATWTLTSGILGSISEVLLVSLRAALQ